jgi:hypothetical protein
LIMHSLLFHLPPSEFLRYKHFKSSHLSPNYHLMKSISNHFIFLFASEILKYSNTTAHTATATATDTAGPVGGRTSSVTQRASIILFLIHTAECCLKLRNLEIVSVIMSCLEMISIYRLRETWKIVEDTVPGKWRTLKSYVGPCGKNLNIELLKLKSPNVPSMSNLMKHLVNLTEEPSFCDLTNTNTGTGRGRGRGKDRDRDSREKRGSISEGERGSVSLFLQIEEKEQVGKEQEGKEQEGKEQEQEHKEESESDEDEDEVEESVGEYSEERDLDFAILSNRRRSVSSSSSAAAGARDHLKDEQREHGEKDERSHEKMINFHKIRKIGKVASLSLHDLLPRLYLLTSSLPLPLFFHS